MFEGLSRGRLPATHSPITLPRYIRQVHDLRVLLDRVTVTDHHDLRAIAARMQAMDRVRIGDGRIITTSLGAWSQRLRSGRVSALRSVVRRIDALDRALHGVHRREWRSGQLRQLDTVLRDPRFHPHLNPLQQIEGWIGDRLTQLFRFLEHQLTFGGPVANPVVTALIAIAFLALVAGGAALLVRAIIDRSTASEVARGMPPEVANPNIARQRAAEMAAAESYRDAFRYLFLATLLELRDANLLQLRPGDTNREYVFSLQAIPDSAIDSEALAALVDEFDRVWYGHQPVTRAAYERGVALAARVLQPPVGGRIA